MASFKGDSRYRTAYDDATVTRSDSDSDIPLDEVEEYLITMKRHDPERKWLERHYDAVQELYTLFKEHGCAVFGNAFFQGGGFGHFYHFIYEHTYLLKV